MPEQQSQTEKRRTFAIISHPDAGKTTLTKLLASRCYNDKNIRKTFESSIRKTFDYKS